MTDPLSYHSITSPLGELYLAETEDGLCRIAWYTTEEAFVTELEWSWNRPVERAPAGSGCATVAAACQLGEYFAGQRRAFDVPLDLAPLRPFQRRVLERLIEVPYGDVVTYGELARLAGYPGAARAVGGAMRDNPLPILVPCHRVLPSSGGLGGFGGRPELKRQLLELEGWRDDTGQASLFSTETRL
jgi:methylated-DNA-[protein]-cysteine S-methyltransferase